MQAAAAAQSKAVARERDDLRALNEQVLRNQQALRQQVAALQAAQGQETSHIKDLEEQVGCHQRTQSMVQTVLARCAAQAAGAITQALCTVCILCCMRSVC